MNKAAAAVATTPEGLLFLLSFFLFHVNGILLSKSIIKHYRSNVIYLVQVQGLGLKESLYSKMGSNKFNNKNK